MRTHCPQEKVILNVKDYICMCTYFILKKGYTFIKIYWNLQSKKNRKMRKRSQALRWKLVSGREGLIHENTRGA